MKLQQLIKIIIIIALVAPLQSHSFKTFSSNVSIDSLAESKIDFVYMEHDRLVFDIALRKFPSAGGKIIILDQNDNILFEDQILKPEYLKRFKIDRSNLEKLSFQVYKKGFHFSKTFNILTRIEEKVEVVKGN